MTSGLQGKNPFLPCSGNQIDSHASLGSSQDNPPNSSSNSNQYLEFAKQLSARSISRRKFLKVSVGTIVGLPFAMKGWAQDHSTSPSIGHAIPTSDYFNQNNFPNRLEPKPRKILARDQTRLLLAFKDRPKPAALQSFLNTTGLALERPSPQGSLRRERINNSQRHYWVRKDQPDDQYSPIDQETFARLAQELGQTLVWVGPVYSYRGARDPRLLFCAPPHVLLLKFAADIGNTLPPSLARALNAAHLREVPRKSQFLNSYRYFEIEVPGSGTVFQFYELVREGHVPFVEDAKLDGISLLRTSTADPLWGSGNDGQWNLRHINIQDAWALSRGSPNVVIFVIDGGFDSIDRADGKGPHPDVRFVHPGIDLNLQDVFSAEYWGDTVEPEHGTACAGIAAAITDNAMGIAGIAGGSGATSGCGIYPLVWTAPQNYIGIVQAFNLAAQIQSGALPSTDEAYIPPPPGGSVMSISVSQTWWDLDNNWSVGPWDDDMIDPAIAAARSAGIVICASSGNDDRDDGPIVLQDGSTVNRAGVLYPGTNQNVIACGASNKADTRVKISSTTTWGSNYGSYLSVVAPGTAIPSTDLQDFPDPDDPDPRYIRGDYYGNFGGTSAAAPHVAGVAALLRSRYITMSPKQVRDIIERTTQKVGGFTYTEVANKPNGPWHKEMGYGLIDAYRALDFADMIIKDHPTDDGTEPFPLPASYNFEESDIVVSPVDNIFTDADFDNRNNPTLKRFQQGTDNYLYTRVTNKGPNTARNVNIDARLVNPNRAINYPNSWTALIDTHHRIPQLEPPSSLPLPPIPSNTSRIVKFKVLRSDVDWMNHHWGGASIALARVTSDNDYAFQTALTTGSNLIRRRNNLALTMIVIGGGDRTPPHPPMNLRVQ